MFVSRNMGQQFCKILRTQGSPKKMKRVTSFFLSEYHSCSNRGSCSLMLRWPARSNEPQSPLYCLDHSTWSELIAFLNTSDICMLFGTNDEKVLYHLSRCVRVLQFTEKDTSSLVYLFRSTVAFRLQKVHLPSNLVQSQLFKCLHSMPLAQHLSKIILNNLYIHNETILTLPPTLTSLQINNISFDDARLSEFEDFYKKSPIVAMNGAKLVKIGFGCSSELIKVAKFLVRDLISESHSTLRKLKWDCSVDCDLTQHNQLTHVSFGLRARQHKLVFGSRPSIHSVACSEYLLVEPYHMMDRGVCLTELVILTSFDCFNIGIFGRDSAPEYDVSPFKSLTRLRIIDYRSRPPTSKITCAPDGNLTIEVSTQLQKVCNLGPGTVRVQASKIGMHALSSSECPCNGIYDLSKAHHLQLDIDQVCREGTGDKMFRGCQAPNCQWRNCSVASRFSHLKSVFYQVSRKNFSFGIIERMVPNTLLHLELELVGESTKKYFEMEWLPPTLQHLCLRGFNLSARLFEILPHNLMSLSFCAHADAPNFASFVNFKLRHQLTPMDIKIQDIQMQQSDYEIIKSVFLQYVVICETSQKDTDLQCLRIFSRPH